MRLRGRPDDDFCAPAQHEEFDLPLNRMRHCPSEGMS